MPTVTTFDALLSGLTWHGVETSGRPLFLTYSFDSAFPAYLAGGFPPGFLESFQPFTAAEQAVARQALKAWADVSGITLFEVPAGQGDIRFGTYDFRLGPEDIEDSAAFAFNPYVVDWESGAEEEEFGGDIFVDIGQVTFDVLAHEIGHALGLKHPFEGQVVLEDALDLVANTVMSYDSSGGVATALGPFDIQAIQHLYGPQSADGTQVASWSWDAAALTLAQTAGAGDDTLAGVGVADRISGGAGNDYILSRAGADYIEGGEGGDTIAGGADADTIAGGAGNDELDGDDGADTLSGGDGDDDLYGLAGNDALDGGAGRDYLSGGYGVNTLSGGAGDDVLVMFEGKSAVDGGEGFDELWLSPAGSSLKLSYASLTAGGGSYANIEAVAFFGSDTADTLEGGDLPDSLMGYAGADSLTGGGGADDLFGDTGADTLAGGSGADALVGWSGDDLLLPGPGVDTIWGDTGTDTVDFSSELGAVYVTVNADRPTEGGIERMSGVENIVGSPFGDSILGDAAANRLFGGLGADTVQGGDGANYLRGDDGADSLGGGANFDDINGNMGDDTGSGGLGDDWVVGGKDRDALAGDDGNDLVYGNLGNDTCDGGAGADTLRGGQDDDIVRGGEGADYVSGDRGADTMTGGGGADIFHSFGEAGVDRVTDFSAADGDRVQLDPGTQYAVAQVGGDTVITMTGGGQMTLVGVTLSGLPAGWIFGA